MDFLGCYKWISWGATNGLSGELGNRELHRAGGNRTDHPATRDDRTTGNTRITLKTPRTSDCDFR